MLRNYDKRSFGTIELSTTIRASDAVVKFLDDKLPEFPKFLKMQNLSNPNEDLITSNLEMYLQRQARNTDEIFMFQFQAPERNSKRSTDISVVYASTFSSTESFFVIEAKRLPTPGSGREREYVQGNLGAIERFKRGFHGRHLDQSAIFGYIQSKTFDDWHTSISSWIDELIATNTDNTIIWDTRDALSFSQTINGVNKYISKNSRIGLSQISLTHFWININ